MSSTVSGILLIFFGALAILGAALNWRIIMGSYKLFNRVVGEKIARPVYIAVGFVLIVLGIGRLAGIGWLNR